MYDLILVGGSGQRFGLALGYLNVIGLAKMPDRVLIVDAEGSAADANNPISRRARSFLQFGSQQRIVQHKSPYRIPVDAARQDNLQIADCIQLGRSRLFPLSFTKHEETRSISRGFYANPKTAALVFRALLQSDPSWSADASMGGGSGKHRVAVVGSVAGGTGAGILREIGRTYRDAGCSVIGIVFSRYFEIPDAGRKDMPQTSDLDFNARLGCDHLLADTDSPFDVLALVGSPANKPMPPPTPTELGTPHAFPGFLLAATLLSDGGELLWDAYEEELRRRERVADERKRLTIAFAGRVNEIPLKELDVFFPTQGRFVSAATLRDAAAEAERALLQWRKFPFEAAGQSLSLFVRMKLTAAVVSSLAALESNGKFSRTSLASLAAEVARRDGAVDASVDAMRSFRDWMATMHGRLLERPRADAAGVRRRSWRHALRPCAAQRGENAHALFAQLWCQQIAANQWSTVPEPRREGGTATWMFPYTQDICPKKPGDWGEYAGDVEIVDVQHESYPTAFGPAFAFAKGIGLRRPDDLETAKTLWLALAGGWLDIEVVDLESAESEFDRVAQLVEGPQGRFIGLLKVGARDRLPESLQTLSGKVVGATHPTCGLWPGVREDVAQAIAQLRNAFTPRDRTSACRVLNRWVQYVPRGEPGQLPAWRIVVQDLVTDDTPMEFGDIRTLGPCLLQTGPGQTGLFHLFAWEPGRGAKIEAMLVRLAQDDGRLEGDIISYGSAPRARVHLQLCEPNHHLDPEATLRGGYLDVDDLRIDVAGEPHSPADIQSGLRRLNVPSQLVELLLQNGLDTQTLRGGPSARLPDILWTRPVGRSTVPTHGRRVAVPLPHTRDQPYPLSNVWGAPQDVEGIYYHPGRQRWVVWLYDPTYNPQGNIRPLSGTTVRVHEGETSWVTMEFPEDSLILSPRDILTTEFYSFQGTDNEEVRPAVPVDSNNLDLVECREDNAPGSVNQNGDYVHEVRLVGGVSINATVPSRLVTRESRLNLEVWPNIPHPAWQRFWFAAESDRPETGQLAFVVYGRSANGSYERIGSHSGLGNFTVRGRPRLIWIGTKRKGAGFVIFSDEGMVGIGAQPQESTVAVDFGTFQTTVVVGTGNSQRVWPAASFGNLRMAMVDNAQEAQSVRSNESFFPEAPLSSGRSATALDILTSARFSSSLVFPRDGAVPSDQSVPFVDYGVPFRLLDRRSEYPETAEQNQDGLKWATGENATARRTAFLKVALVLGAAEAFRQGGTILNVRYSFPLAFPRPDDLQRAFEEARRWLRAEVVATDGSRVEIRLQTVDSESAAGIRAAEAFGDFVLTLDLGGGTLDLGLFRKERNEIRPLGWDSVRLGGNLVSAMYALRKNIEDLRSVRWAILNNQLGANGGVDDGVRTDTTRLIALVLEYAARFAAGTLKAYEPEDAVDLSVALLGSGWRWHGYVNEDAAGRFEPGAFSSEYESLLTQRVQALGQDAFRISAVRFNTRALREGLEKLAVSVGLTWLDPGLVRETAGIKAPNGIEEREHSWWEVVSPETRFDTPKGISAIPPFPEALNLRAPLQEHLQGEMLEVVLTRLQEATLSGGQRRRTALGIVYEVLKERWFRR